jgi:hypothetical protein
VGAANRAKALRRDRCRVALHFFEQSARALEVGRVAEELVQCESRHPNHGVADGRELRVAGEAIELADEIANGLARFASVLGTLDVGADEGGKALNIVPVRRGNAKGGGPLFFASIRGKWS